MKDKQLREAVLELYNELEDILCDKRNELETPAGRKIRELVQGSTNRG